MTSGERGDVCAKRLPPRKPHAQPSRQFLRELPGDAAGAGAAGGRPFERLALQLLVGDLDAEMAAIAAHHCEILVLAAAMESEPETETIRQRDLLLNGLARIDGGRALVLDHFAGEQVPPVRGGVEDDVVWTSLDTALQ